MLDTHSVYCEHSLDGPSILNVTAMKYFTIEWWSGCQTGDDGHAVERYQAHAASIRSRLSPELLSIHEGISLHDATLISLRIISDHREAVLRLQLPTNRQIELRYKALSGFDSLHMPSMALGGPGGFGHLGYDEIDVLADNTFEHRLLFSSSIELRFRFAAIELHGMPALREADPGNRLAP